MKPSLKTILCTAISTSVLLCISFTANAEENTDNSNSSSSPVIYEDETFDDGILTYTKAKDGVYITSCTSGVTSINIGKSIDNYKILGIYDQAFYGSQGLRSVTIADEIEYIGNGAFLGCDSLTDVTLPKNLTEIPEYCFYGCSKLENIEIPETVTSIGAYALSLTALGETLNIGENVEFIGYLSFAGCKNLTDFNVSEKNSTYTSIDGILYNKDGSSLQIFPSGKNIKEFNVASTVSRIEYGAFFDNPYIETVNIPDSVQTMGGEIFFRCTALKSVTLPKETPIITEYMFSDCTTLSKIEIPDSVTTISDGAFYGCTSLKEITIPDSVVNIGENALGFTDSDDPSNADKPQKIKDFKILANKDTAAKDYAKENGISIDYLNGSSFPIWIPVIVGVVLLSIIAFLIKRKTTKSSM